MSSSLKIIKYFSVWVRGCGGILFYRPMRNSDGTKPEGYYISGYTYREDGIVYPTAIEICTWRPHWEVFAIGCVRSQCRMERMLKITRLVVRILYLILWYMYVYFIYPFGKLFTSLQINLCMWSRVGVSYNENSNEYERKWRCITRVLFSGRIMTMYHNVWYWIILRQFFSWL